MSTPIRRWPEDEIDTLVNMPVAYPPRPDPPTPPAPVKRKIMEQEPRPQRPPTREEVEQIEDQILRMAFKKTMKTMRLRTLVMVFMTGIMAGFVLLGTIFVILVTKAGV